MFLHLQSVLAKILKRLFIDSFGHKKASIAQLVEQLICNQLVGGSSPSAGSFFYVGGILKRPTRTDCKSVGFTFAGSNPAPPTIDLVKCHQICGSSSVGRASAFQAECRGFESRLPLGNVLCEKKNWGPPRRQPVIHSQCNRVITYNRY